MVALGRVTARTIAAVDRHLLDPLSALRIDNACRKGRNEFDICVQPKIARGIGAHLMFVAQAIGDDHNLLRCSSAIVRVMQVLHDRAPHLVKRCVELVIFVRMALHAAATWVHQGAVFVLVRPNLFRMTDGLGHGPEQTAKLNTGQGGCAHP